MPKQPPRTRYKRYSRGSTLACGSPAAGTKNQDFEPVQVLFGFWKPVDWGLCVRKGNFCWHVVIFYVSIVSCVWLGTITSSPVRINSFVSFLFSIFFSFYRCLRDWLLALCLCTKVLPVYTSSCHTIPPTLMPTLWIQSSWPLNWPFWPQMRRSITSILRTNRSRCRKTLRTWRWWVMFIRMWFVDCVIMRWMLTNKTYIREVFGYFPG